MVPYLRNADLIKVMHMPYKVRGQKAPLVSEIFCSALPGSVVSQGWRWHVLLIRQGVNHGANTYKKV